MIGHLLRSKGPSAIFHRGQAITQRVGVTSRRMEDALLGFIKVAEQYGARITFPVTALTLARNQAFMRRLAAHRQTVELAVHGFRHVDHSLLPEAAVTTELEQALQLFRRASIPVTGFRAPYLRWNTALLQALEQAGMTYDSSQSVLWPVVGELAPQQRAAVDTLLTFDQPAPAEPGAAMPRRTGSLVEIPVSFPDDEMLVERMGLTATEDISHYWIRAFDLCHASGECFVLQLHPERFPQCAAALEQLLQHARGASGGIWLASLDDVACWERTGERGWPGGAQSALVLSGDIDAMTLWDYAQRLRGH
jgi:peptidoglycan/xylan/chitin deacetylase (PgdA/CDA1 family)